jgi:predicted RNA binding protein YcfA (HicA-like mRNA interferase family)
VKVARVLSILRADGWYLDRVRGSHRQLQHLEKPGTVTVPGKPSEELHPKTLASIRKQARLEDLR